MSDRTWLFGRRQRRLSSSRRDSKAAISALLLSLPQREPVYFARVQSALIQLDRESGQYKKWANEITWITAERMRAGQPLGKESLRSAGVACMKASGREETGGYGKLCNESKLARVGREPKNR